jgi:hypothetical protein
MISRIALITMAGVIVASCNSYVQHQQQQEAEIKAADAALDRDRIMVQTGDIALPHEQLGVLQYVEPFSPKAIDENYIDDKLRRMAIQRWGNQVDAIVELKSSLSTDASQVTVSAEGVRVNGDCSFCRHQGGYPQGQ